MTGFTTYDAKGNAEDIVDIIYDISPTERPFMTMLRKNVKATAKIHEWQEDALSSPSNLGNKHVEGADAPPAVMTATSLLFNYTQIFANTANVTGSQESVDHYGRKSEMKYQLTKKLKELGNDIEYAFVGDRLQVKDLGSNTVARQMECAQNQISVDTTVDSGATALVEDDLVAVLEKCYVEGGYPDMLFIAPIHAKAIAGYASTTGRERLIDDKRLINAIDIYESPYGNVDVVMDRFFDPLSAIACDPEYWSLASLRPTFTKKLPENGDYIAAENINECTLACLSAKASGLIQMQP